MLTKTKPARSDMDTHRSYLKVPRHESEPWRKAVASLPCVICWREGDTQAAHRNERKGMAIKPDDCFTAALCTSCHADIDQGSSYTRHDRRERMDAAILATIRQLAIAGLIGVKR